MPPMPLWEPLLPSLLVLVKKWSIVTGGEGACCEDERTRAGRFVLDSFWRTCLGVALVRFDEPAGDPSIKYLTPSRRYDFCLDQLLRLVSAYVWLWYCQDHSIRLFATDLRSIAPRLEGLGFLHRIASVRSVLPFWLYQSVILYVSQSAAVS